MNLDLHLTTFILEAFAKPLGVWDHCVDVIVLVVTVVDSLVYVVAVLGLITTISIVVVGLKSV